MALCLGSILTGANLRDDADTTTAIAGQIAGAYYGEQGIPQRWLDRLAMKQEIADMAKGLSTYDLKR